MCLCRHAQVFDHDRNGFIDRSELRLTMKRLGEQLNDEDLDAMMRSADTDGDGCIDLDGAYVPSRPLQSRVVL